MTYPTLEIFSQGDEIVTGQTVDTNAAWLSQACVTMGFTVTRHTAVGDTIDQLIALLKEISSRADCCICTGGLGPTSDDLTAEAAAQAFSMPLRFDPIAFEQIACFFMNRGKPMPDSNRKQAFMPREATRIDNQWGTAPGFTLQNDRCRFFFLPGVPFEMRQLFNEYVKPFLERHYRLVPQQLVSIKTIGLGESDIQSKLAGLQLPADIKLGFRAGPEHIETKLLAPPHYPQEKIDAHLDEIKSRLGDYIFGIDDAHHRCDDLASTIDDMMRSKRRTVIFVETISQGLMAAKCTADNNWLLESLYRRNAECHTDRFAADLIDTDLHHRAEIIAHSLKKEGCTDLVLIQLFQEEATPSGKDNRITIYNTLLAPEGFIHTKHTIGGTAKRKQTQAAILALDLLRRYLQNLT